MEKPAPAVVEKSVSEPMHYHAEFIRRLSRATVPEMSGIIYDALGAVLPEQSTPGSLYETMTRLAALLPQRPPVTKQHELQQAITGSDVSLAQAGREGSLFLHMKSILAAIRPYLSDDGADNDAILQEAVVDVLEILPQLKTTAQLSLQIHHHAQQAAEKYISIRENVPQGMVRQNAYRDIKEELHGVMQQYPEGIPQGLLDEIIEDKSKAYGISPKTMRAYYEFLVWINDQAKRVESDVLEETWDGLRQRAINESLDVLSRRERLVIELRFGLGNNDLYTLSEIGEVVGVSVERVRQIEYEALNKLRRLDGDRLYSYYREL